MRRLILLSLVVLAVAGAAWSQAAPTTAPTVTQVLDRSLSGPEKELVSLAEAMPEDKFNFAPTNGEFKGVRTFAEQVRHVAYVNHIIAAAVLGEKPTWQSDNSENGPQYKSKAEILKALNDSFAYMHKAIASVNEKNQTELIAGPFGGKATRLGIIILDTGHIFDHYGQCVEYARMNGIIPPASRQ